MHILGEFHLDSCSEISADKAVAAVLAYITQLAKRLAREDHEAELERTRQRKSEGS